MKAAFVLAIETGLRRTALTQLRWEWIDLEKRVVNISAELREIENKGLPIRISL
jgi:integrase